MLSYRVCIYLLLVFAGKHLKVYKPASHYITHCLSMNLSKHYCMCRSYVQSYMESSTWFSVFIGWLKLSK